MREVLGDVTREAFPGCNVQVVRTGEDVLEALPRLDRPCAAVLHWAIAEEHGAECLRRLREARIPILLISAWDLARAVASLGPTEGALQKPFELGEYIGALQRLLRAPVATAAGA